MRVSPTAGLLAAFLLAISGCGSDARTERDEGRAPQFKPLELMGTLPGSPLKDIFRDEDGRPLKGVHRLLFTSSGGQRVALLLGRRGGTPCVGASADDTSVARLDCFERWENPPLVVRVVVGGTTRRRTDWLAVLGLARSPTARMILDSQSSQDTPLAVRSWPGFPWKAFAAFTRKGDLGNMLSALDQRGEPVVRVELSWSYDPPCQQDNRDVCGTTPPPGRWSESRDPIADASGADESSHAIVFAHPAIRRLLAGHTFFVNPTTGWQKCDGSYLGSVVSLRIWPPVTFSGEIPLHEYAGDDEDVAYREGRVYVEAERVASVQAWVDRARKHVVGIELDAFDETEALEDQSKVRIKKRDVVVESKPAGGPDDADQCPKHEPGD